MTEHWLSRYATNYHAWHFTTENTRKTFTRPMGFLETSFDCDGRYFGKDSILDYRYRVLIGHTLQAAVET